MYGNIEGKKFLVQEWIYRGKLLGIENHDKYFESEADATSFYNERVEHLKQVKLTEDIFSSFVRIFKMKKSDIARDGIGVDYLIERIEV